MKYFKIIIFSLLLASGVLIAIACEPDDICAEDTPTTPSLIIEFNDASNPGELKNVFDLLVIGVGNENVLSGYDFVDTDDVYLPLKTTENTTQYTLIEGAFINDNGTPDDASDDYIDGNPDVITINYSREEVFVSRACGYKTIYKNVTLTIEPDADNWMLSRQPVTENQSVVNEDGPQFIISH